MGIVYPGIPKPIVSELISHFKIDTFIETGTYKGGTAYWASQLFPKVITVENSEGLWQETKARYAAQTNMECLYGDSRKILASLVEQIHTPSLFWLDAHWCYGITYGKEDECALAGELAEINRIDADTFILIDDARLFLFPPPLPHQHNYYPTISEVMKLLDQKPRYTLIMDDAIISIPASAKPVMVDYFQSISTAHWNEYLAKTAPKVTFLGKTKKRMTHNINTLKKKIRQGIK